MVDENGVVRIVGTVTFTDPDNQPVFNGGTITQDLAIHGQTDAVELSVVPVANQNNNVIETQDGSGNVAFVVDAGGNIVTGQIDAQPGSDIRAFRAIGASGGSADVADFVTGASATIFRITNAGAVGFFGATPATKPAVTGAKLPSDTVMASLLTALAALGLVTDSTT